MQKFKVLKTNHTGLTVSDIDRSLAFFHDVLGFDVTEKARHAGAPAERITGVPGAEMEIAFVEAPGHQIELMKYLKPDDRKVSELRPCDTGFAHLAFEVDDVDAVLEAIQTAGFVAVNPPEIPLAGPRKGGKVVYTRNLDGLVLEFQQSPGK